MKDLAAMISNIAKISGRQKISFIGHSLGTTCFLILASYRPRLVQNIDLAILMAPVVIIIQCSPLSLVERFIVS